MRRTKAPYFLGILQLRVGWGRGCRPARKGALVYKHHAVVRRAVTQSQSGDSSSQAVCSQHPVQKQGQQEAQKEAALFLQA